MFIVGKRYDYDMIDPRGGVVTCSGIVERYEYPLLKFADHDLSESVFATPRPPRGSGHTVASSIVRGEIINVTSIHFVKAALRDELELA